MVLTTAARELPLRSAATASRIAQLAVVDCLFVGVAQRSYDAAGALLRGTYDSGAGPPREGALAMDIGTLTTEARNPADRPTSTRCRCPSSSPS